MSICIFNSVYTVQSKQEFQRITYLTTSRAYVNVLSQELQASSNLPNMATATTTTGTGTPASSEDQNMTHTIQDLRKNKNKIHVFVYDLRNFINEPTYGVPLIKGRLDDEEVQAIKSTTV
ncbi:hypothetical protein EG327_009156 [Venturia inaequalis]|uniref:Uncharacterized protein n=1 Tax=Venturia inaequalis TaxID=5025 RepID=A0A8H3ZFM6_VENIN|nr:hypothetical protein EG327_009156 [Venturia inaequalis]